MPADLHLAHESSAASLRSAGAALALSGARRTLALVDFAMRDQGTALRLVERAQADLQRLHGHLLAQKDARR